MVSMKRILCTGDWIGMIHLQIGDGNGHFPFDFACQLFNLLQYAQLLGVSGPICRSNFSMQLIGQTEQFAGVREHGRLAGSIAH